MKKLSRIFALLMAVMMVVSLIGVSVYADETPTYEATDSYVLNFSSQDVDGYEDWDEKRLYASPYRTDIYVTENGKLSNWNWCSANVMNMINTTKIGTVENAAEPYASIAVYCVDAITDGVPGYSYRRVNLEDSGYYSDTTAGRIRAIITNSFPHTKEADVAAAVNAWDAANGDKYAEVVNLNHSEIISATQSVIWTLTNDGKLGDPVYAGFEQDAFGYDAATGESDQIVYDESMAFEVTDNTANNINAVAAYLNALAPMAPQDTVITDSSIGDTTMTIEQAEDGSYTATVTAVVTANVDDDDKLTLTAVMGGEVVDTQTVLDGTNTYTVTIAGLETATEAVTIHIDGTQTASDVFLFDPLNGRDASQSMAGYVAGDALPVHAEATVAPRILNLTKRGYVTETVDGEEVKKEIVLENIQFEIYYVGSVEDYANGDLVLSNPPQVSDEELGLYVTGVNYVATITTDANGKASYNFTVNGQPDGIYIVKELNHESTTGPMAPFYLEVPQTDENGNLVTTIEIRPKNDVKGEEIEIEKDVTDIDNEHDTYDVGEHHTWIIQSSIPEGLGTGLKYEITDTLDTRLTLVSVDRVAVAPDKGTFGSSEGAGYVKDEDETPAFEETILLEKGTHYNVTTTKTEGGNDHFVMALTAEGMAHVAEQAGEAYSDYEIRVYFTAYINTSAAMDAAIPNEADVDYTNNVGMDYHADSDKPDVITGAGQFLKVDSSDADKVLTGATFLVYRLAEEGDTDIEYIEIDGVETAAVKAAFYGNAALTGDKVYEVVSDANGKGMIYGLAYGDYYLVETKAPDGYHLLDEPAKLTIKQGSSADAIEVTICNSSKFQLPETGGIGTAVFTFGGIGIIGAAALVLLGGKKKRS